MIFNEFGKGFWSLWGGFWEGLGRVLGRFGKGFWQGLGVFGTPEESLALFWLFDVWRSLAFFGCLGLAVCNCCCFLLIFFVCFLLFFLLFITFAGLGVAKGSVENYG